MLEMSSGHRVNLLHYWLAYIPTKSIVDCQKSPLSRMYPHAKVYAKR